MKAKLPGGLGTWPAFWLMDVPSLLNPKLNHLEIDVLEEYGDDPGSLHTTVHLWDSAEWNKSWGKESVSPECSMIQSFHTYGLDIQEDFLTFYFDRRRVWQFPNAIPGFSDKYDRELYVMVDLAYGGGSSRNNASNLDNNPRDMLVEYVRVWQGSGGSKGPNSTALWGSASFRTAGLSLKPSEQVNINGANLGFTTTGNLEVTDSKGSILWQTGTTSSCSTGCTAIFQNDGNLVLYSADGKVIWGANTWNNNMGSMAFNSQPPYLQIFNQECTVLWSSK